MKTGSIKIVFASITSFALFGISSAAAENFSASYSPGSIPPTAQTVAIANPSAFPLASPPAYAVTNPTTVTVVSPPALPPASEYPSVDLPEETLSGGEVTEELIAVEETTCGAPSLNTQEYLPANSFALP